MDLKIIGDLFLCFMILGGAVVFTVANLNYTPERKKEDEDR